MQGINTAAHISFIHFYCTPLLQTTPRISQQTSDPRTSRVSCRIGPCWFQPVVGAEQTSVKQSQGTLCWTLLNLQDLESIEGRHTGFSATLTTT